EYAIVSGKNFFNGFLSAVEPTINPLRGLFAKIGLNLSVAETGVVSLIIIAAVVGSLIMLLTK
ncbi:MAG: hypothetical protein ABFR31_02155, partial [Thermodesulfobacteriota bacterium]